MKTKFTIPVLVATLPFSGPLALAASAQASPAYSVSTVFSCVRHDNSFATIAQRGDRTTQPVITWNTTLGQYTPEERCQIVSQRLTDVVARHGGKLSNLQLTAGTVNRQAVICVVNNMQPVCNNSNMLFTLRPENANSVSEILARLYNFSVLGDGSPVLT